MLHNEKLWNGTYEIRHDNNGNAIHVFISDYYGSAIVFPTLEDFIKYCYLSRSEVEKFNCPKEFLEDLYESSHYAYYTLKEFYKIAYQN